MSRKSKRQSRKKAARRSTTGSSQTESIARKAIEDFNPDYSQTIKDLRRIGVLAGTFFMVLIALSFFLR